MNSLFRSTMTVRQKLWMLAIPLLLISNSGLAQDAATSTADGSAIWNTLLLLIVFAATAGSGVLNVAAIRQWDKNWGLVSGLPLLALFIWVAIIVFSRSLDPSSHALWAFEIFAWAMINMIYMVTAMTAKRMFAKRDDAAAAKP